jgi:hypothetical protein
LSSSQPYVNPTIPSWVTDDDCRAPYTLSDATGERERESQRVRESESQRVRESESQREREREKGETKRERDERGAKGERSDRKVGRGRKRERGEDTGEGEKGTGPEGCRVKGGQPGIAIPGFARDHFCLEIF